MVPLRSVMRYVDHNVIVVDLLLISYPKGSKRSSLRLNSISGTESTSSDSTLSLSSSLTLGNGSSSTDITNKIAEDHKEIVKFEKCKQSTSQLACGPIVSLSSKSLCSEESKSMNHPISSDEINSCTSSDNCYDATSSATSCSKKVRRIMRRVSSKCKQMDQQEKRTLPYSDQVQLQGRKYLDANVY